MKKVFISLMFLAMFSAIFGGIQEDLEKFGIENGKGYIKPFVNAFGTNLNTGLYNTAKVLKPFTFGLNVNMMASFVPKEDKTFLPTRPDIMIRDANGDPIQYMGQNIYLYEVPDGKTATCFGEDGGTIVHNLLLDNPTLLSTLGLTQDDVNSLDIPLPNGANLPAVPLVVPQFQLGLPAGNELMVRGFPKYEINKDIGEVGFWGIGLKHSISQYIPLVPIDVAVQGVYQSLFVGDIITISNIAFNAEISKKLLMWTIYGGLGYEKTKLNVDYETEVQAYDPVDETFNPEVLDIDFDIEGDNNFRTTAGLRFSVLLLKIYADYTISKYSVFNAGIGVSF